MFGGDRRHLPPAAPQTRCPDPGRAGSAAGLFPTTPCRTRGRFCRCRGKSRRWRLLNCWTGVCRMVSGRSAGMWDVGGGLRGPVRAGESRSWPVYGGSGVSGGGGWYRSIRSGGTWVSWVWVLTGVRGRVNPG